MKFTLLPPQEAPKGYTAFRRSRSLGEHMQGFLGANNIRDFLDDLQMEEPIIEEVAAMWLIVVSDNINWRQEEAMKMYRQQQWFERQAKRASQRKKLTLPKKDVKRATVSVELQQSKRPQMTKTRPTPSEEFQQYAAQSSRIYDTVKRPPANSLSPNDEYLRAKRRGMKAYDVAYPNAIPTFYNEPLRDSEYRSRLEAILSESELLIAKEGQLDQQLCVRGVIDEKDVHIFHETISRRYVVATRSFESMRAVTAEQARAIAENYQKSIDEGFQLSPEVERLNNMLYKAPPKSDPTGHYRLNPHLK